MFDTLVPALESLPSEAEHPRRIQAIHTAVASKRTIVTSAPILLRAVHYLPPPRHMAGCWNLRVSSGSNQGLMPPLFVTDYRVSVEGRGGRVLASMRGARPLPPVAASW